MRSQYLPASPDFSLHHYPQPPPTRNPRSRDRRNTTARREPTAGSPQGAVSRNPNAVKHSEAIYRKAYRKKHSQLYTESARNATPQQPGVEVLPEFPSVEGTPPGRARL